MIFNEIISRVIITKQLLVAALSSTLVLNNLYIVKYLHSNTAQDIYLNISVLDYWLSASVNMSFEQLAVLYFLDVCLKSYGSLRSTESDSDRQHRGLTLSSVSITLNSPGLGQRTESRYL